MLHYRSQGTGPHTLVLIHGFCEDHTCFDEQVLFFKAHGKVITPDLPGFGKSQSIMGITLEQMADSIAAMLDFEKVDKCVMLGHSMGGYVTLAFAERYPNRLKAFGLIHSTALPDNEERKEKRKQVVKFLEKNGKEPYIKNFIPTLFAEGANPEIIEKGVAMGLESDQQGIIQAIYAMMQRPDRQLLLQNSQVPVFFAAGQHDSLIPAEVIFEQAALCEQAEVINLQQSGHMGMLEEPGKLNAAIEKFINRL